MRERRLAIKLIEVRSNEPRVLHPDTVVPHEIRNTSRWIDLVIGAVGNARLNHQNPDAIRESLLVHDNAGDPSIRRSRGGIEFRGSSLRHRLLQRKVCCGCAPWKGGAFQWV